MNTWSRIHSATFKQLFLSRTLDDIYRHSVTFKPISLRRALDDIQMPQLSNNFPSEEHLMICALHNFHTNFLNLKTMLWRTVNTCWYIIGCFPLCQTDRSEIGGTNQGKMERYSSKETKLSTGPKLPFPSTWWSIHSATFKQLSLWWTSTFKQYFQTVLSNRFSSDERWWMMIYFHSATFKEHSLWWTRNNIYTPQLEDNFPCDEHLMMYTFCNFKITFLVKNTWWYIHSTTLYQLSLWWTRDYIHIQQI